MTEHLTQLERALLELVVEGDGQYSWHNIGTRLSNMDVPRQPDMMMTLKSLQARGLLDCEVTPGSPSDRWMITRAGKTALEAKK